jgi:phosphinothricin acetyltransferase
VIAVREATTGDMDSYAAIVNHYIATTTSNYRTEPQTVDEWRADWDAARSRFPWLVAVDGDIVVGIAYAAAWKTRAAYARTVETTIYLAPDHLGRGIGHALYRELLARLDGAGFHTEIAVISVPNPASVALHEAHGFAHVGTLREVGHKFGDWCSTGFWQRIAP